MRSEWDPAKSDANTRLRGFDFECASGIFGGPTIEREDRRRDYGERRFLATGATGDVLLTVCYTDRVDADGVVTRRIISARRSNRHERKAYEAFIARG